MIERKGSLKPVSTSPAKFQKALSKLFSPKKTEKVSYESTCTHTREGKLRN